MCDTKSMDNQNTMQFTQVNFDASQLPNVWERYYNMANGNVAVITKIDTTGDAEVLETTYTVITHTEIPGTTTPDWWDTVIKEVAYCGTLEEAEGVVALLLKGQLV